MSQGQVQSSQLEFWLSVGLLLLPVTRVEHFQVRKVFWVLIVIGWLAYHAHMGFLLV